MLPHRLGTASALSVFRQGNKDGAEVAPHGSLQLHR
jgi:hypothetical protein